MPSDAPKPTLTTSEVAAILGEPGLPLSRERVRQLDDVLRPARGPGRRGRERHYDPAIVELVRLERARKARR